MRRGKAEFCSSEGMRPDAFDEYSHVKWLWLESRAFLVSALQVHGADVNGRALPQVPVVVFKPH